MLKIHHFPRGRGLRVVWQCEEMGLAYEIEPVAFPLTDEYRKLNPAGGVPFLEDDGGVAINESVAMMLYLAQKYGPTPLLPAARDPLFARVLQFTIYGEATLGMWINTIMLARFYFPAAGTPPPCAAPNKNREAINPVKSRAHPVQTVAADHAPTANDTPAFNPIRSMTRPINGADIA